MHKYIAIYCKTSVFFACQKVCGPDFSCFSDTYKFTRNSFSTQTVRLDSSTVLAENKANILMSLTSSLKQKLLDIKLLVKEGFHWKNNKEQSFCK